MRLTESIFQKRAAIKTDDSYKLSLDIMKRMSDFTKVIEKRNIYMTDGPRHRSEVIFDATHELDEHTKIKISFTLIGEENTLNIDIEGVITVNIIRYGIVSGVFSDYYMKNIYPEIKKSTESKTNGLIKQVNKIINIM